MAAMGIDWLTTLEILAEVEYIPCGGLIGL